MRKEATKTRQLKIARVVGYHCGDHEKYLVFASDRPVEADENYRLLSDGTLMPMYGIEVETQGWGITNQTIYGNVLKHICMENFHEDLWKIEEDGSLRRRAEAYAECITQPMTKAYIRNHYRDFKAMFDWFKVMGISCDKTGDCGMHTHISNTCFGREKKTQDEAIKKFIYIVNRHYDLMRSLVYRRLDNDGTTHYFGQMNVDGIKDWDLSNGYDDHYVCINLGHYDEGNIELRLVGGQKNFPCFRNTMESVFHLVEVSKKISWNDCDDIVKIFKGCNQYVFDRLSSYVREQGHISQEQLDKILSTVITMDLI